jgi:hypothetical protein
MSTPVARPPMPAAPPATPAPRRYEPPRLGGKQALAQVTLFSGACTPGTPGCTIGHP